MTAFVRKHVLVLLLAATAVACGDIELPDEHLRSQSLTHPQRPSKQQNQARPADSRYTTDTFALMPNPIECPPPLPGEDGDPDQPDPTCTDPTQTEEVEPRCFVPLGDPQLRREIAQTFRVSDVGKPGRLRVLLTRFQDLPAPDGDPDYEKRPAFEVEIRDLGDPDDEESFYDENLGVPLDSTRTVATGAIARKHIMNGRLGLNDDVEHIINLSGIDGETLLEPNHIYALVFLIPDGDEMSFGIGCHNKDDVYKGAAEPWFSAYSRQMRQLGNGDFTDPQFIADTRTILFSLSLDDGCITGETLECGVGVCYRNDWPLCVLGEFNEDPCEPRWDLQTAEVCDGLDNDCNGVVDDPPVLTCGTGVCYNEEPACTTQKDGLGNEILDGDGKPIPIDNTCDPLDPEPFEICDGLDNTCNGLTDDGLGFIECGSGRCFDRVPYCVGGAVNNCSPKEHLKKLVESCNGIDDTCDGTIDMVSGFPMTQKYWENPQPLNPGTGEPYGVCKRGVEVCDVPHKADYVEDSNGVVIMDPRVPEPESWDRSDPAGDPIYPSAEACDGKDNNCNGIVDDGGMQKYCYTGSSTDVMTPPSICHGGLQTCQPQAPQSGGNAPIWGACQGEQTPKTEICSAFDENCNGQVNEISAVGTKPCGTGICASTIGNCLGTENSTCEAFAAANGTTVNDPYGVALPEELCNNKDDTCDGRTDEVFVGGLWQKMTRNCLNGIPNVGECSSGQQTCGAVTPGVWGPCVGAKDTRLSHDVCNNKDDNCNGQTDESNSNLCPVTPSMNVASYSCDTFAVAPIKRCVYTCQNGYYDFDGNPGCECKFEHQGAEICSAMAPGGTFPTNMSQGAIIKTGNMAENKTKAHFYRFRFPAVSTQFGGGAPTIKLETLGPGPKVYSMKIHYGSCTGAAPTGAGVGIKGGSSSHPDAKAFCAHNVTKTDWNYVDDCNGNTGPNRCLPPRYSNWPTDVYIEVYRTDALLGSNDCREYRLTASR